MLEKTDGVIKNGQHRDNDNFGYTRGKQINKQTQHRDNDNFGYTRGRQTNKQQQIQHRKLKR